MKTSKYSKDNLNLIKEAIKEIYPDSKIPKDFKLTKVVKTPKYKPSTYIVVQWPESQMIMNKSWFNECELIDTTFGQRNHGSSAYLVPKNRYDSL